MVSNALKDTFKKFGSQIYELETDKGTEFLGKKTKKIFKENNILFKVKSGKNKANFATIASFYLVYFPRNNLLAEFLTGADSSKHDHLPK